MTDVEVRYKEYKEYKEYRQRYYKQQDFLMNALFVVVFAGCIGILAIPYENGLNSIMTVIYSIILQ